MELSNGAVTSHEQATPDLGTDFSYPDPQLIDLHRLVCIAHAFLSCDTRLHGVYRYRLLKENKMVLPASKHFAPILEWSPPNGKQKYLCIGHCFSDFWGAYQTVIPAEQHTAVGKETGETAHVERWNNTLRQRLARFVRKTLSFSKSPVMHEACLRLFLHRYNLAQAIMFV